MGFRRGSRSSRKQKNPSGITPESPAQLTQTDSDQFTQGGMNEVYSEMERERAEFARGIVARENARQRQQDQIREEKEQRRQALKQSRKAKRREQANQKKAFNQAKRNPVKRETDPRLAVSGQSFRIVGQNVRGETLYQPLGPVVEERKIMKRTKKDKLMSDLRDIATQQGVAVVDTVEFEE